MDTTGVDVAEVREQVRRAAAELLAAAGLRPGEILVVGCSTSEIAGQRIGTAGSVELADAVLDGLENALAGSGVFLAVQCCEHLNRALVVEGEAAGRHNLEPVTVYPVPGAGGALAARAMDRYTAPVVVEEIRAHAGLDIGQTLIGMHLKRVAVPVRLSVGRVGHAVLTAARTRPKLIGGERARYRKCT